MQGSSTTSVLLKWVRHSQFLKGNIFQFQGNLTWWTNTSSLVSFLQDKKKLKFVNKTHSKLKIQLSGTEPKCRPIITGFEHQPYSSTCSQLVPISLLCVEKRSAGSLHEVQSTCWRFSKAHCSSLLHTSLSFTSHQWRCLNTRHSLLSSGALRETGYCSFWKQLCLCHWSLTYIPSASKFLSPEEQQHHLPLKAALSDKPQFLLSGNRKQLGSVSTGTHEHPSFSMTLAELPQLPWARTTTAQYQLQSEFSILLWRVTTETPLRWLELHKPSPPLLKHGHPSSHHTNPPSLQY